MKRPFVIEDLLYDTDFSQYGVSDVSKIAGFCTYNNITPLDLLNKLKRHKSRLPDEERGGKELFETQMWISILEKLLRRRETLVGKLRVSDSRMTDNRGNEYAAHFSKNEDGDDIVQILIKKQDDDDGNTTGIPNVWYWESTPAQYYVHTLLKNMYSDKLIIDGGSDWLIRGMANLKQEMLKKIGNRPITYGGRYS